MDLDVADDGKWAFILPTTAPIGDWFRRVGAVRPPVIGRADIKGNTRATDLLCVAGAVDAPRRVVIHTDQLCRASEATVRIDLADQQVFLSPVEMILNTKYNYSLLVWTAGGLREVPADSRLKDIAAVLVEHLRDCATLGAEWLERDRQIERTLSHRRRLGRRKLRYLRSSVASAFADHPTVDAASTYLANIGTLEAAFAAADTA